MGEQETIIVAIEFGSSKIAGIAGKIKDGNMQIVAYAEDKTPDCVKRGVVYNIEKTTQSIKNIVSKIETILKLKVAKVYVGVNGQSVRSVFKNVHCNMQTPTCINQNHIDTLTEESHEVPHDDYELIYFFPQEYIIDSNIVSDPVGVVGTNLEGKYLNIIANNRVKNNINTCFDNTDISVADYKVSSIELAINVLTDTEKRSGCALIDLGAGTTTVVVYKNNLVRLLATIPLGYNNIVQDLCSLQIDEPEALELLKKYGNGMPGDELLQEGEEPSSYTTSDGRNIKVTEIQFIIVARLYEILSNVRTQIVKSEFFKSLLGGLVLSGGGANLKNIENAVMHVVKIDKVRIARKVTEPVIKNSTLTNLTLDNPSSNTIVSLLLSGTENCVSDIPAGDPDMFVNQKTESEIGARKISAANAQKEDEDALGMLESIKGKLREAIARLQESRADIESDGSSKRAREEASDLVLEATSIIGQDYDHCTHQLIGKDKYKQTLREAEDLIAKRDEEAKN